MSIVDGLPQEMWEAILHNIPLMSMSTEDRLSCLLVCKRWTTVLEPILFSEITLFYSDTMSPRMSQLLNFIAVKPELAQNVRSLTVYFGKIDDWVHTRALKLLDMCKRLHTLDLNLPNWEPELPRLYYQACREKYVSLLRHTSGLKLDILRLNNFAYDMIIEGLTNHHITRLEFSLDATGSYDQKLLEGNGSILTDMLERTAGPGERPQLKSHYLRTGNFKHMAILRCSITLQDLSILLQWTTGLYSLTLDRVLLETVESSHGLNNMLQTHCQDLQSLTLRNIHMPNYNERVISGPWPVLDAGRGLNLTFLSLSLTNLDNAFRSTGSESDIAKHPYVPIRPYVGPKLRTLVITFGHGYEIKYDEYSVEVVTSVFKFVKDSIEQNATSRTPSILETINVRVLRRFYGYRDDKDPIDWPTTATIELKKMMRSVNVNVAFFRFNLT